MGADQNLDWNRLAASALEWWRDAGVDALVDEPPRNWLAPPPAAPAAFIPAPAPQPGDVLAETLDSFLAYRSGADAPEAGWPGVRITAAGPASAALMILVDCPEKDDRECLMEGAVGRLFDRMLAAIGQSRETVHLAAVAYARPLAGRLPRDTQDRLAALARHHIALVGPKRLIVMGDAASRAICAMDVREARGRLQPLNHRSGQMIDMVSTYHPRLLIERPALKAEAWRDLQLAIGGLAS
ncbi:Uracil-DNA glycosylase [Sphingomonas sp. EC-HK361]|uniref:uracil-DNA glycosylase family protein n=1 Tax=Sphingomonas sp. EC-HK361 TaxID=2038397 RepID=UPI00125A729B|nr:uracil-DNA glycosylase family protein [Sphingomonas sp. EC-HK361]VVT03196.1 Uracil-DNA glycosylase [Sphingomonas sp. EC-HK361]